MDETAMLAFGILLEEASAEALGKTGDLAYVEEDDDEMDTNRLPRNVYWQNGRSRESALARNHSRQGARHDVPMRNEKPSSARRRA